MTGNIATFIRSRVNEERRQHRSGFQPFRERLFDALEAVLDEHRDSGPGVLYANGEQHRFRLACKTCGRHDEYAVEWPCKTVREIAWIWSEHPDFDTAAWSPPEKSLE